MGIRRVTLTMLYYGQFCQNVLHFRANDEGLADLAVADEIKANWISQIRIPLTVDVQFVSMTIRDLGSGTETPVNILPAVFGAQLNETQNVPFVAWVLRFNTGRAGRKFRGRCYLPGYRHGDTQEGVLNTGGAQIWEAPLAALKNRFTDGGTGPLTLVIHGAHESHDTPVTSITLRTTLGAQRRRNIGVGL
jgi:hypothetical protein